MTDIVRLLACVHSLRLLALYVFLSPQMMEAGMDILAHKQVEFSEEDVRSFYHHRREEVTFDETVTYMTTGPSIAIILSKGETGELF